MLNFWVKMRHSAISLVAVIALIIGGMGFFGESTTVQAKNAYEIECTYYDQYGNVVGGLMYHCYGSYSWGIQTCYYECIQGDDCYLGF